MQKWEYKWVQEPDDKTLNALGAQGWELVTVVNTSGSGILRAYFKRPISD